MVRRGRSTALLSVALISIGATAVVAAGPAQAAVPSLGILSSIGLAQEGGGRAVFSADGALAFVPSGEGLHATGSIVSVISTHSSKVWGVIAVRDDPEQIVLSPNGAFLYTVNSGTGTVSAISTSTLSVLKTITVSPPHGSDTSLGNTRVLVFSPDSSTAYVSNIVANTVSVINTATRTVTATIPVGPHPRQLLMSPDGARVYVLNSAGRSVSVISTATQTVTAVATLGVQPDQMAFAHGGTAIYVTAGGAPGDTTPMAILDTSSLSVDNTLAVGPAPHHIALAPGGARAYVTDGNGRVRVFNTANDQLIGQVSVPTSPGIGGDPFAGVFDLAVSPTGSRLFAAAQYGNTGEGIAIDTASLTVTDVFDIAGASRSLAIAPSGQAYYHAVGGPVDVVGPLTEPAPTVTLQPKDQFGGLGTSVELIARAVGVPAPSVQWERSVDAVTFTPIAGATSSTYRFAKVTHASAALYRAVFTNSAATVTSRAAALSVGPEATTMTTLSSAPTTDFGAPVTLTADVSSLVPSAYRPTGTVTFGSGSAALAVVPVNARGIATMTTKALPVGDGLINVSYSGDSRFAASFGSLTQTVLADRELAGSITTAIYVPEGQAYSLHGASAAKVFVYGAGSLDVEDSFIGQLVAFGSAALRVCGSSVNELDVAYASGFVLAGDEPEGCPSNTFTTIGLLDNNYGVQSFGNTITGTGFAVGNAGKGPFPGDTAPHIDVSVT